MCSGRYMKRQNAKGGRNGAEPFLGGCSMADGFPGTEDSWAHLGMPGLRPGRPSIWWSPQPGASGDPNI